MQIMILDLRAFQDYPGKKKLRRRCQSFLPKPSRAEQRISSSGTETKAKREQTPWPALLVGVDYYHHLPFATN
jgi:hypothetical protein